MVVLWFVGNLYFPISISSEGCSKRERSKLNVNCVFKYMFTHRSTNISYFSGLIFLYILKTQGLPASLVLYLFTNNKNLHLKEVCGNEF